MSRPPSSMPPSPVMQMHVHHQQRLSLPYDLAAAQHQQQQAAAAAAAGYTFPPGRPSLPFGAELYDPAAAHTRQQPHFDPLSQHFQPRGSIATLSGTSSGSSPYNSASPMPTTPTSIEQPQMVNPWFFPFAVGTMGGLPINPQQMQYWMGKTPPGRQRTNQACEKCRDRKTKCTGERPSCHRCAMRGLQCEYASEHRVRGPAKNRKRNTASVDLTNSGAPVSPAVSTPDTSLHPATLEDDAEVGASAPAIITGQDEQWTKPDSSTANCLFHDWMQQSSSSLGLSLPNGDVVKQEDLGVFDEHIDTAAPHPDSSASFMRYSASMPHLHLPYDSYSHSAVPPPVLPMDPSARLVSLPHDNQSDAGAEFAWTVPHFDQSQDVPPHLHLHRPEDLNGGASESSADAEHLSTPPQSFSFASAPRQTLVNYSDIRSHGSGTQGHIIREQSQTHATSMPVPSSNGYWFALAAKQTHPLTMEPKEVDGDAQSQDASSASFSWAGDDQHSRSATSDSSLALPDSLPLSEDGDMKVPHELEQTTSHDSLFDDDTQPSAA